MPALALVDLCALPLPGLMPPACPAHGGVLQARLGSGAEGCTQPAAAAATVAVAGGSSAFMAARQAQQQIAEARSRALAGGGSKAGGNSAAKKGGAAGGAPQAVRGCWLDTLKVKAAAKRKAAVLGHTRAAANKRAAQGQPGAGAAAATAGAAACGSQGGGGDDEVMELTPPFVYGPAAYTVLYKFNEGYTNAVKRPLKMAELLQEHASSQM